MKTLILLRHAKSAWPVGVKDLERPLNKRGIRNAPQAGEWIHDRYSAPDKIVVSPARRTRQTWSLVAEAAGIDEAKARVDDRVYAASWWDLLDLIRETPETAASLLVVGHNPGLEDLAFELAGSGDPVLLRQLRAKFPTAGIAVLNGELPWAKWGSRCASLDDLEVPRRAVET